MCMCDKCNKDENGNRGVFEIEGGFNLGQMITMIAGEKKGNTALNISSTMEEVNDKMNMSGGSAINHDVVTKDMVKFAYTNKPCYVNSHDGVVTVASYREGDIVYFGESYCSPEDTYDKHYGCDLAVARLNNDPFIIDVSKNESCHKIRLRIFAAIFASKSYPSWAEEDVLFELASAVRIIRL